MAASTDVQHICHVSTMPLPSSRSSLEDCECMKNCALIDELFLLSTQEQPESERESTLLRLGCSNTPINCVSWVLKNKSFPAEKRLSIWFKPYVSRLPGNLVIFIVVLLFFDTLFRVLNHSCYDDWFVLWDCATLTPCLSPPWEPENKYTLDTSIYHEGGHDMYNYIHFCIVSVKLKGWI